MMSAINLRALVRDHLAATDEADPGVIADRVLSAIPKAQYEAVIGQMMRLYVRQVISETRTSSRPSNSPIRSTPSTSWKGNAIRDGWQRQLDSRLHVGESEWKLLRDCTHADLLAVAAERQEKAEQNAAWARTYRAYAAAVDAAGVATFGELPAVEQMYLLGGAA